MKTLKATSLVLAVSLPLLALSLPSQASMSPHMKTALVDVCKAAKSNHLYRLNSTLKSYRLKEKTIALKVLCNGTDIISFAEQYGATKTASKLQNSIGDVNIIDVAKVSKINVVFAE